MAQVKDLRTQNLELQRSHQELSQAVASTAGISQSYGDRMTQILSTLAKLDAAVQGYRRISKVMEAHRRLAWRIILKCPTATQLSALAQCSHPLRITPPLHPGSMPGNTGTPRLQNPLRSSCPCHRRLHPFVILNRRRLRRPWARHPVHPVVGVSFLSPSTHPTIASAIRTLVRIRGGRGGGGEHHEHPHPQEPTSWRGTAEKQKEPAIPEWRATPEGEEHPTEPTAPWANEEENTSPLGNINPLTKNVFNSPGKPSYAPSHPTDTCTISAVKVAPSASGGAPPTMAPPAYHPYQMPTV